MTSRIPKLLLSCLVVAMFVSASAGPAYAASPPINSGRFQLSFSQFSGTSTYVVKYSFPSEVTSGKPFAVTGLVEITQLSGLKLYLVSYELQATLFLSNGKAFTQQVRVNGVTNHSYLYSGSHWGPINVTIPINDSAAGLSPGESVSGYASLRFIADVQYDYPISWHYPETDARDIGNINLVSQSGQGASNPSYLTYLAIAAVVAVGALGIVVYMRRQRNGGGPSKVAELEPTGHDPIGTS